VARKTNAKNKRKGGARARGRPKGSTNAEADVITVEPSRCRRCGSTRRSEYYGKAEQAFHGVHNGRLFAHIARRRTKRVDCGQLRIDRTYENRPRRNNSDPE